MQRHLLLGFGLMLLALAGCTPARTTPPPPVPPPVTASLDLAILKPTGGFVTGDGALDCGFDGGATDRTTCSASLTVPGASTVTLTAAAATGYHFAGWAGDCSGAQATCALSAPASGAASFQVGAAFEADPASAPTPGAPLSRVYGYVLDADHGGAKLAGIKVTLGADVLNADGSVKAAAPTATTTATGWFVIDAAPGAYALNLADTNAKDASGNPKYLVPATGSLTLPALGDAACLAASPLADPALGATGCFLRSDVTTVTANPAYAAPAPPFAITATATPATTLGPAGTKLAGFGQPVALSCKATPADSTSTATYAVGWTVTAGPVAVPVSGAPGAGLAGGVAFTGQSLTTPLVADVLAATKAAMAGGANVAACPNGPGAGKPGSPAAGAAGGNARLGCGVSNFLSESRPGFLTVNQGQAGEFTYTLTCTVTDSNGVTLSKTASLPLVVAQNINLGNTLENLWNRGNAILGTPANGAIDRFGNPVVFRGSHFGAKAVTGAIVIVDDVQGRPEGYAWQWRKTSKAGGTPTTSSCLASPVTCDPAAGTPTLFAADTANPWFYATGTAGLVVNVNATSAQLPLALTFTPSWGGYQNNCVTCHDPSWGDPAKPLTFDGNLQAKTGYELGPSKLVVEWAASRHARIVTDGMSGTHYSTSCLKCHVLGYETALANVGWDDLAKGGTFGWAAPAGATFTSAAYAFPDFTFLPTPQAAFAAMPVELQKRSNVQCESCHGPAGAGGAGAATCNGNAIDPSGVACNSGGSTSHDASESSKMCGFCHDSGHHGLYSEWNASRHADLGTMATALSKSLDSNTPTTGRGACYACHTAQRFIDYSTSLMAGSARAPAPVPTLEGFAGFAVDRYTGSPVTCQACHEPHSLELRVSGAAATKPIPLGDPAGDLCTDPADCAAGVSGLVASRSGLVLGAASGAGALCSSCHNSRGTNGLQQDRTTVAPVVFAKPHHGPQTDVYLGANMFWFKAPSGALGGNVHAGSFFPDTCADCHVKLIPAGYATMSNHTFRPDPSCLTCHGAGEVLGAPGTKGKAVQDQTAGQLAAIQAALRSAVASYVASAAGTVTATNDAASGTVQAPGAAVTLSGHVLTDVQVAVSGLWLEPGFSIWLDGNTTATPDLQTNVGSLQLDGSPVVTPSNANVWLFQALWNYLLVAQDRSLGLHNPFVVNDLLADTLGEVQGATLR
ncbi:MAG TPA: hypothetical protein VML50_00930 [Anaeromyxobacter sp.]|nr:hypothetical protein [Anaeromyxobacter sp.]